MEGIKLNDQIKHIFKEAILDFQVGAQSGNNTAVHHLGKFSRFLEEGIVPLADLGYIYHFYQNQKKDVDQLTDKRLDPLKAEVNYMVNFLDSNYKFEDNCGIISVEARS